MKHSKMTITIRDDQKAWIKDHPEFNLSGLVQKCIDAYMELIRNDALTRLGDVLEDYQLGPEERAEILERVR